MSEPAFAAIVLSGLAYVFPMICIIANAIDFHGREQLQRRVALAVIWPIALVVWILFGVVELCRKGLE